VGILANIIAGILAMFDGPMSQDQLAATLDAKAAVAGEPLDWRNSIVDLMKLTGQDSSLQNRERLAAELGYEGHFNGDPQMNIWLHQQVMERLATSIT